MRIEFRRSFDQIDIEVINKDDNSISILNEHSQDVINAVLCIIKRDYTQAFEALQNVYGNAAYFKFLMVRRFIKCNMSSSDSVTDFDGEKFNFENVVCPMRGECKWDNIICKPKFNTSLTDRELEIAKLIAEDLTDEKIADRVFISIFTVQNHKKNIYKKLGFNNRAQLVKYINDFFENEK